MSTTEQENRKKEKAWYKGKGTLLEVTCNNVTFSCLNWSKPKELLHKWIDDLCANKQLINSDNIVFFIKNGEFFARI